MSTPVSHEVDAFSRIVEERLSGRELTLEECLAAYRVYQAELTRFRVEVAPAIAELDVGKATPLDIDAIIQRGKATLESEGIQG